MRGAALTPRRTGGGDSIGGNPIALLGVSCRPHGRCRAVMRVCATLTVTDEQLLVRQEDQEKVTLQVGLCVA
jgi:hypothetical protein